MQRVSKTDQKTGLGGLGVLGLCHGGNEHVIPIVYNVVAKPMNSLAMQRVSKNDQKTGLGGVGILGLCHGGN